MLHKISGQISSFVNIRQFTKNSAGYIITAYAVKSQVTADLKGNLWNSMLSRAEHSLRARFR